MNQKTTFKNLKIPSIINVMEFLDTESVMACKLIKNINIFRFYCKYLKEVNF